MSTSSTVRLANRSSSASAESRQKMYVLHPVSATHAARDIAHCTEQLGAGATRSTHADVPLALHGVSAHDCSVGDATGAAVVGLNVGACVGALLTATVGALDAFESQRSPNQPLPQVQFTPTNVVEEQLALMRHSAADRSRRSAPGWSDEPHTSTSSTVRSANKSSSRSIDSRQNMAWLHPLSDTQEAIRAEQMSVQLLGVTTSTTSTQLTVPSA